MGQDWPIISLKQARWHIFFIIVFKTGISREHSGKVSRKSFDNFFSEESTHLKYLLLTEFEVLTVSNGPTFFR